MKVKVKLTIEQFKFLLNYINSAVYEKIIFFNELELMNLRAFLGVGFKKIIDLQSALTFTPTKEKTFNIEVNQFHVILSLLHKQREFLDAYTLAIYNDLTRQNKTFFTIGFNS